MWSRVFVSSKTNISIKFRSKKNKVSGSLKGCRRTPQNYSDMNWKISCFWIPGGELNVC